MQVLPHDTWLEKICQAGACVMNMYRCWGIIWLQPVHTSYLQLAQHVVFIYYVGQIAGCIFAACGTLNIQKRPVNLFLTTIFCNAFI